MGQYDDYYAEQKANGADWDFSVLIPEARKLWEVWTDIAHGPHSKLWDEIITQRGRDTETMGNALEYLIEDLPDEVYRAAKP